ncbi:RagB/SusD family nutrient uptake outer membrane protein [Sphingobacterium haloxyli]|uniref:RagB/SusD family nutrient uptake outer membrane protein n=1 Tax=Sphingobacterium haloxyli TaxID=2100533 RepID=A0A2S9IYD1_9SPHI|nr:RagB/SusD family nutrient uptake outer membrane protein [Sphingobacterium haloxyli]PRD45533.1 RagB/SusD family nutrient uptake outer membrane protein [Sphingobacterium haloxyli]
MKKLSILYIPIILVAIASSCKQLVQIDLPKDELTTEKVFSDSTNANAAIVGIYVRMQGGLNLCSGSLSIYPALSADELYLASATEENGQFFANALLPINNTVGGIWSTAYSFIYDQNACIEGITQSDNIREDQKAELVAEARVIRAFLYFNLVNLYGAVPLVLTTDYDHSRTLSRMPVEVVYDQIISDLLYAKSTLPLTVDQNFRANSDAATALLARVYLYRGNYAAAIEQATEIIESGRYTLAPTPNEVFSAQSTETIWNLLPVNPARATWEGFNFIPSSPTRIPTYVLSEALLDSFDEDDLRASQWVGHSTVNGQIYAYPYKYKMRTSAGQTNVERYVVLRLAEQYLIRSEAAAEMGDIQGSTADINVIRIRAGLLATADGYDREFILNEIAKQRRLELMCEWGHRWYDLKRTGVADAVLSNVKPNWRPSAELFPIPQTQINRNPFLSQNTGY